MANTELLFDFPKVEITKPIRLIEAFGGIGSQAIALRDIGANFEHYRLIEFDKYAVASYNAIHGTAFETMDIRDVHADDLGITECDKYTYIMTYSFPCTDLSVAGKMKGMSKADWENGNSTRSGLLWEVERILKECKKEELPQILLMENVPQVHAEKNKQDFEAWLEFLRGKGYHNFYKDLNAKDYGIPQNRDRCFCVSILSDEYVEFDFPKPEKLNLVMKDMLESKVDEKYYINNDKAKKLIQKLIENETLKSAKKEEKKTIDLCLKNPEEIKVANCITARENRSVSNLKKVGNGVIIKNCIKEVGFMPHNNGTIHQSNKVYSSDAISPSLNAVLGTHHNIIKIIEKSGSYKYLGEDKIIVAMRGRNPDRPTDRTAGLPTEQRLEPAPQGVVNTLTTVQKDNLLLEKKIKKVGQISSEGSQCGTVVSEEGLAPTLSAGTHGYANAHVMTVGTVYRIRKLTPRECWRLMGYTDEDFDKAQKVNSATQLYKQAGNAIVKQVLMAIFRAMNIQRRNNDVDISTEKRMVRED